MIRVFAHWESKKCCAYFIFPSRLHIMIQSVPVPGGPGLLFIIIYIIESQESSCETLLYNWREQQQNWASLFIAGSFGWFYQALSQLSAFLHFNYQSKFLFCLFLHFTNQTFFCSMLYIFYVYKYIDIYICVMTSHIHHILYISYKTAQLPAIFSRKFYIFLS